MDRCGVAYIVSTHMPLARHDSGIPKGTYDIKVSTHMPLARHDVLSVGSASYVMWFLLTCLLQGMTCSLTGSAISWMFLLTCLLRGMTSKWQEIRPEWYVSTHMPLARHDQPLGSGYTLTRVSTHMPLARHDGVIVSMVKH